MCLSPVPHFFFLFKTTNTQPTSTFCIFISFFILQHAYAFFKSRRLQALRQLKRDRGDPETSESESDSESDNDTDKGSNNLFTAENSGQDDGSTPFHKKRKKKKRRKKNKDGKKRRAMWTEDEHRLFLDGYKAHPRDWSYLAKIVTSKTPTQIRTHAYSVFQRRRRVGTPLPSGFENMVSKYIKNEKKRRHAL